MNEESDVFPFIYPTTKSNNVQKATLNEILNYRPELLGKKHVPGFIQFLEQKLVMSPSKENKALGLAASFPSALIGTKEKKTKLRYLIRPSGDLLSSVDPHHEPNLVPYKHNHSINFSESSVRPLTSNVVDRKVIVRGKEFQLPVKVSTAQEPRENGYLNKNTNPPLSYSNESTNTWETFKNESRFSPNSCDESLSSDYMSFYSATGSTRSGSRAGSSRGSRYWDPALHRSHTFASKLKVTPEHIKIDSLEAGFGTLYDRNAWSVTAEEERSLQCRKDIRTIYGKAPPNSGGPTGPKPKLEIGSLSETRSSMHKKKPEKYVNIVQQVKDVRAKLALERKRPTVGQIPTQSDTLMSDAIQEKNEKG